VVIRQTKDYYYYNTSKNKNPKESKEIRFEKERQQRIKQISLKLA